ncbi:MAG: hypothetical protein IJ795_00110 [Bacteroidales bacterium]|nr:hypothetical protein [Bacteroidales bacterium]
MKKTILALVAAILCCGMQAQEHLDYNGVPIDGSMASCMKALRKQGFKPKSKDGDNHYMRGKFYGDEVEMFIATTAVSQTAYLFVVSYPAASMWSTAKSRYEYAKMRLSVLYNEPTNVVEKFEFPYTEDDGLRAVEYGKCLYISTWSMSKGEVSLTISKDARVQVFYTDKANMALAGKEAN